MLFSQHSIGLLLLVVALMVLASCKEEIVPNLFHPRNDHEAYLYSLEQAGLLKTALGRDWRKQAQISIEKPLDVEMPHEEAFYFHDDKAEALAFRFSAKRGQKIQMEVLPATEETRLFIDLFRLEVPQENTALLHVASAERESNQLAFEPRRDADYIVRIQPELLRGGRFTCKIQIGPSLEFPVLGAANRDIGSFFGDPRDGGRRKHHGIDIFAKRHTPILAPTDGYIRFVGERGLGGQVVWMRDLERDMTLYFAHLQTIIAEDDTYVKKGDTLGTVGNTGNARTTPPHLHFGIYKNGPVDPYHFVAQTNSRLHPVKGDVELVGKEVRTKRSSLLGEVQNSSFDDVLPLEKWQYLEVLGAARDKYRVQTPAGVIGLISINDVELIDNPIDNVELPEQLLVVDLPASDHSIIEEKRSDQVVILARDTAYWFVQSDTGTAGWVAVL